jgi:membrane protein DedA with SNARE-associated domain
MYFLSLHGNRAINWFYNKFLAKLLPPNPTFIEDHINKVVFMSRFLVQLRFLGPFFAGRTKMKLKKFLVLDVSALIIYVTVLLWAGHYFANRIDAIFDGIGTLKNILLILLGVFVLWSAGQVVKRGLFSKVKSGSSGENILK